MTTSDADITLKGLAVSVKDIGTSLEDLAGMVARGFGDLTKRIDDFEERVEARFTKVEHTLELSSMNMQTFAYEQDRLKTRVEHLEESEFGSIQEP